ncbi:MAG TPA: hypothetical protein VIH36_07455 [Casimicrobiaceae bacterium]|jgi:hypothetical protein
MRTLAIMTLAGGIAAAIPAVAAEKSAACKPLFDAVEKVAVTDHAIRIVRGGTTSESITANGVTYVQVRGAWKASPMTSQQMLAQQRENIRTARAYVCQPIADSVVNGVKAHTYRAHMEAADGDPVSDATISIAAGSGLLLHTEEDLKSAGMVSHMSIDYRYDGIRAPVAH